MRSKPWFGNLHTGSEKVGISTKICWSLGPSHVNLWQHHARTKKRTCRAEEVGAERRRLRTNAAITWGRERKDEKRNLSDRIFLVEFRTNHSWLCMSRHFPPFSPRMIKIEMSWRQQCAEHMCSVLWRFERACHARGETQNQEFLPVLRRTRINNNIMMIDSWQQTY
jgi:hypothetical protein